MTTLERRPRARRWDSIEAEKRFRARVAELGGRVVEPEWLGIAKPHRAVCAEGHECKPRPNNLDYAKYMCETCARKAGPRIKSDRAYEEFKQRLQTAGATLLEPEWLGSGKPHRAICARGHACNPYPNRLQQGGGFCATCGGNDTRVAQANFHEYVSSSGGRVSEPQWLGANRPHRVICAEGHEVRIIPSNAHQGRESLCSVCAGRDSKVLFQRLVTRVKELGGQLLDSEWLGSSTPHKTVCAAGHAGTAVPDRLLSPRYVERGYGFCPVCAGRDSATTNARFRERVEALGGRVLEAEWLGNGTPHLCVCVRGHECRPRPTSLDRGQGICRVCAGQDPVTSERTFRSLVAELGGKLVEPQYLGATVPHRVICENGHACAPRPAGLNRGKGLCRKCIGKVWDIFYVVCNPISHRVKFGVTTKNGARTAAGHRRLGEHATVGYTDVSRFLDVRQAGQLEQHVIATLTAAGFAPVHGREYYDVSALPVILDVADHWEVAVV